MTFKLANNITEISEKKSSTEEKENQRNNKPAVHVKAEHEQRSMALPKELDKIDICQIADNKCKSNTHPLFVVDFNLEINNR